MLRTTSRLDKNCYLFKLFEQASPGICVPLLGSQVNDVVNQLLNIYVICRGNLTKPTWETTFCGRGVVEQLWVLKVYVQSRKI